MQIPPSRGENKATWFMDYFSGEFGQLGTQFDALGHAGMKLKMADGSEKEVFYNGFTFSCRLSDKLTLAPGAGIGRSAVPSS